MKHRLLYLTIAALFLLSFVDCAKKGTPSGGKKDTIPPVIIKSVPENYSINFEENEIRIYFDEYIKLKDLQKNLIISPPLKYAPTITPLSTSKYIKIKILDTLTDNTTYSINFGQSIVDNNEENPYQYFKYVFSTGPYIDSLKLSGKVRDALLRKPQASTKVFLYEVNDTYNDSMVFSEKPMYITTIQDSTSTFELTNLKEGNYLLLALDEKNNDFTFQSATDKIGFENSIISVPTDQSYLLSLFKENRPYKISRPKQITKNHIIFGFEGGMKNVSLQLESVVPEDFVSAIFNEPKADTLHYWFKPAVENDSLLFVAKYDDVKDTLNVRMRNLYKDSLSVSPLNSSAIVLPLDTLKLKANIPLRTIDAEKIKIIDTDSVEIPASAQINRKFNLAEVVFPKTEDKIYRIQLLPGALTDFFETSNDTLKFSVRTKALSDYGTLTFNVTTAEQKSLIVQLVDSKFNVVDETPLVPSKAVHFDYIIPGAYYVRVVFDENQNKIWDTGNFLMRIQPEKVLYYPSQLEIRANWSLNESFSLD